MLSYSVKNSLKVIAILFIVPVLLIAQTGEYQELVDKAKLFLQQNNTEQAINYLKNAIKKNESGVEASLLLAKLYYKQKNWSTAKSYYKQILKYHSQNSEAHYYAGICEREAGQLQDPVRRIFTFRSAAKHFEAVIRHDPTYREVFNAYAKLELLRKEYERAIDLCLKQIKIHPLAQAPRQDIFKYYDFYLVHGVHGLTDVFTNTDSAQVQWLKQRHTDYDRFFLGEAYRRMGRFSTADSILTGLLKQTLSITKVPVYLSRARLYYQMHRDAEAEKDYWAALDAVRNFYELKFIFDDVKYIMSDADLQVHLPNLDKIRSFYRAFWSKKNLFPGSSVNMRLAEHYRRLIYAEQHFRFDEPRLRINNPDQEGTLQFPKVFYLNHTFNDKGLVYIRYGEPDDRAFTLGSGLESNESWLYHASSLNSKLIFHFEIHPKAKPDDWRLVAVPTDPSMIESRLGWDPALDTYYMAQNDLERASAVSTVRLHSRKSIEKAMDSQRALSLHEVTLLPLSMHTAQFWNEFNEPYFNIYLSVPTKTILTDSSSLEQSIEAGIAILDSKGKILHREFRSISILPTDSSSRILEIFKVVPPKELFVLAAHVLKEEKNTLGGVRLKMTTRSFHPEQLMVSDPVLAYSVSPTQKVNSLSMSGLDIHANPSALFRQDQPVYLYYEIYNLAVKDNHSRYKIEARLKPDSQESFISKILNIFKGNGQQISISKQGQTTAAIVQEYSAFDFSNWGTGNVEISITVEDLNNGQKADFTTHLKIVNN